MEYIYSKLKQRVNKNELLELMKSGQLQSALNKAIADYNEL